VSRYPTSPEIGETITATIEVEWDVGDGFGLNRCNFAVYLSNSETIRGHRWHASDESAIEAGEKWLLFCGYTKRRRHWFSQKRWERTGIANIYSGEEYMRMVSLVRELTSAVDALKLGDKKIDKLLDICRSHVEIPVTAAQSNG